MNIPTPALNYVRINILSSAYVIYTGNWHNSRWFEQTETWWRLMCSNQWWACWRAGWVHNDWMWGIGVVLQTQLCVCVRVHLCVICVLYCDVAYVMLHAFVCEVACVQQSLLLMDCVWLKNSAWLVQNNDLGVTLLPAHHSAFKSGIYLWASINSFSFSLSRPLNLSANSY